MAEEKTAREPRLRRGRAVASAWYRPPIGLVRDSAVIDALQDLAEKHPRRGFWKCCSLAAQDAGRSWNPKRIYWVYKAMRLNLRRAAKRSVCPSASACRSTCRTCRIHPVWSGDFMSDASGPVAAAFEPFNVVDDFNREALHIEVDTSITSTRLVRIFEQLQRDHGLPQVLRTDNGPEFLGEAFTAWAKANGVALQYIQPGKPNQNAYIERFNRTLREEVLDQHLFARIDDVREAAWWWMLEYNEQRPHDSLAIGHRANTVNESPNVLLLQCLLDGGAYVLTLSL